ncbi:MAG: 4Fe-4S binding protein [Bacteroidales bacterium]|nr:4Fe-4S binding protein [Bacteroidales bacterium]
MKLNKLSFWNTVSRILFLLLTPAFFRLFNFGFIWHSIYWGVISFVVLIWFFFLLISPLFGRIGCGWFCFVGTTQDLPFGYSLIKLKKKKPILWLRFIMPIGFFVSSLTFFFLRLRAGEIVGFRFAPTFFSTELNTHYQHIWLYDTLGALLMGVLLEKRWACKNLCVMGSLSAIGSTWSRLIPVIDTESCNLCKQCEQVCLVNIAITDYVNRKHGLVTNSECIQCGRCVDVCKREALKFKFIWSRKRYIATAGRMKTNN